jgi:hypothetical protein
MRLLLLVIASFGSHIPHIVLGSAQEEVIWPNATRIVTPMAHMQAEVECPVGERK